MSQNELKNKTAKGLAWGGAFSLLQQLLGIIFGISIARILSPSDYGVVGLLTIFTALASVLQDCGFVFVLTNRPTISKTEYSSVFWLNILMSLFVYLLLFIGAPVLAGYYGIAELTALSRYVFLGFLISSFGIIQNAYLYRKMMVKENGIASAISLIIAGLIGIIMAKNGFAYWGLATQGLVASFMRTLILWIYSPFRPLFVFDMKFIKTVLPDGIKFALPNFVVAVSGNIYTFILGKFYTVRDVGFYSQAGKFNTYGYSTTLGMLRNVSQPMLVQVRDDREERLKAFRKLVRFTVFVSFPTMLGLAFVAPELVSIVLTPKWLYSAYIMRVICVGGAFVALNTLFTYYLASQNMSSVYMWLGIGTSLFKIPIAIVASLGGVMSLAYACTVYDVIIVVFYYFSSHKSLGYSLKQFRVDILPVLLVVILSILITYFITRGIEELVLLLLSRIFLFSCLYIICLQIIHFDIYIEARKTIFTYINSIWNRIII